MTYPETTVRNLIDAHVVPFQINNQEMINAALIERYRHVWTPDLRVLDAEGIELYHWYGFLPPAEFAAQLLAAVAHARLRQRRYVEAKALYAEVVRRFPTSLVAAEAHYFSGVAAYRASDESSELLHGWHNLEKHFPQSPWAVKQDFH